MSKIVIATVGILGVLSAAEAASQLTRALRSHDRSYQNDEIVQFPLVDGGEGTIDFLVSHTLGSFLEVETVDARGTEAIIPIGFASEDGKLAIIEMKRVAGVLADGDHGTTYGIGELIRDALDEGAFSVLLGLDEPLACDAGLGAVAALGVKFFDEKDRLLDMNIAQPPINKIARVDASGRNFQLLSSRFFIASTQRALQTAPSTMLMGELERLSGIIQRDCDIHANAHALTGSAAAFGLRSFLGAEVQDGTSLILDAALVEENITQTNILLIFANNFEQLDELFLRRFLDAAIKHGKQVILLFANLQNSSSLTKQGYSKDAIHSLSDIQLFQQPLRADATADEIRRDLFMRIEKIIPALSAKMSRSESLGNLTAATS